MNLFQLNQHHEVGNHRTEHRREQIQRHGEEFRTRDCHRLLALLTDDLHEGFRFLGAVIPVARVGCLHHR